MEREEAAELMRAGDEFVTSVRLRGVTLRERGMVVARLSKVLLDGRGQARRLRESGSRLTCEVTLPLEAVDELYMALMECGLELEREGHAALRVLCTLKREAADAWMRTMWLELEVAFAEDPFVECTRLLRPALA